MDVDSVTARGETASVDRCDSTSGHTAREQLEARLLTGASAGEGTGADSVCVRQGRISKGHGMPAETSSLAKEAKEPKVLVKFSSPSIISSGPLVPLPRTTLL